MLKAVAALVVPIPLSIAVTVNPVLAEQQTVTCRPIDERGNNLPYSTGDYTLRCDMFRIMQKDCETSDPVERYYRPYCLNLNRAGPVRR